MELQPSKTKLFFGKLKNIVLPVVCYGGLTGVVVGFIVSIFNLGANYLTGLSVNIYGWFNLHPAFIPLLFVGLAALSFLMYLLHKFTPQVRGSGIPQTEGVIRGIVTFKWLRVLISTFVGSYLSFFAGLSLGSEGPSVQIGATTANGVSRMLGARLSWQRHLITGGASAGLAVAFNAPLTGIVFALEEAHRKFTPMILMSASSSVIFATITYRLFSGLWNIGDKTLFNMGAITPLPTKFVWTLLIVGLVCGSVAIFFNWSLIKSQKFLDKYTKQYPYWARLLVVFLLTGVVGLLLVEANGGGHHLIMQISNFDFSIQMLLLIFVVKMIMILFCFDSGATGGLFIPMLAIGALLGGMCGKLFVMWGMPQDYYKAIVCIAMTTFFGASVRAPITATVLIVEITGFSANFLASIIAIFSAYIVAELLGNKPIYDSMLDRFAKIENKNKTMTTKTFSITLTTHAPIIGKCISDVLWPANCLIESLMRGEESIVADGETRLKLGDKLDLKVETFDTEETDAYLQELISDKVYVRRIQPFHFKKKNVGATKNTSATIDCDNSNNKDDNNIESKK
ncbi:MAG: ClC family H(+)/Cl(-) exchange transporter [Clostridia bacterium]